MPLRDLFSFRNRENQQFGNWPSAPAIRPLRARTDGMDLFPPESDKKDLNADEGKYPPTLIIALGETGARTISLLAEKIAQSSTSGSASVRALLITDSSPTLISSMGRQIRVLELQQPATGSFPKSSHQSFRAWSNLLFQQAINYTRYQEWLKETLLDLGTGIQVFFVGSLAEVTIGVLGDAAQILANFSQGMGKAGLFSRVCAFLSLRSLASFSLPPEEIFSACREINRFAFNGPHKMNGSFGQKPMVESALLDYLFILDDALPSTMPEKQEINIAQLLADSLFSLIHPSARFLWGNMLNDLRLSGQIRQEAHEAVLHSIGAATLYIPLSEIKGYIASRLACAVLLGEQNNANEGLVRSTSSIKEKPQALARRFLLNGPFPHPVFTWLLDANSPNYFSFVPDLSSEFILTFQSQIAHSLSQYLNQSPVDLELAAAALDWLEGHIAGCENWLNSAKSDRPNAPERFSLQHLIFKWRETLRYLSDDLKSWKRNLDDSPSPVQEISAKTPVFTSDWRAVSRANASDWRQDAVVGKSQSILTLLKSRQFEAESALSRASSDTIYRSVLTDAQGGLKELETYYIDTVRPELSKIGAGAGASFARIQRRLEWWIHLAPDRLPQLYLLCWPASTRPLSEPPAGVRFRSDQAHALASALVELALSQTESLESDLTINWFGRRIKSLAKFLQRAEDAYLEYDRNSASQLANAATRRSYLISSDPTLSRDLVGDIFPNTPRFEVNELSGGQKTRFTALTLRLNVPFVSIFKTQEFQREYVEKASASFHLYSQEQNAVAYEKRLWKLQRTRILLVPEIATLLADPQLVTLFFQALFVGKIKIERDEISNQSYWTVVPVGGFPPVWLSPVENDGLLLALKRFALEMPNASDLNQNPRNHFYPSNRSNYISALTTQVKESLFKAEARVVMESLKPEFKVWEAKAEHNELARSFHALIVCEQDEPVWAGW